MLERAATEGEPNFTGDTHQPSRWLSDLLGAACRAGLASRSWSLVGGHHCLKEARRDRLALAAEPSLFAVLELQFEGRLSYAKGPDLFCEIAARATTDVRFADRAWHIWGAGPMRQEREQKSSNGSNRPHGYRSIAVSGVVWPSSATPPMSGRPSARRRHQRAQTRARRWISAAPAPTVNTRQKLLNQHVEQTRFFQIDSVT